MNFLKSDRHENNGFVLGWVVGALLLILSANVLAFLALGLGVALLACRLLQKPRSGLSNSVASAAPRS